MPEPMTTMGSSSRHTAGCARAAGRRLVRSQVPWRPSAPTRSAVAAMFENGARGGREKGNSGLSTREINEGLRTRRTHQQHYVDLLPRRLFLVLRSSRSEPGRLSGR